MVGRVIILPIKLTEIEGTTAIEPSTNRPKKEAKRANLPSCELCGYIQCQTEEANLDQDRF